MQQNILAFSFMIIWIALGIAGWVLFHRGNDAAFKRKWFPRYTMFAGILFGVFVMLITTSDPNNTAPPGILVLLVPVIGLICYINFRMIKFCGKCGRMIHTTNMFSPPKFCSQCGAPIETTPPTQH